MEHEPFSNPLAPPSSIPSKSEDVAQDRSQPLTNADFRKLMMTPRVGSHHSGQASIPGSVRGSIRSKHYKISQQKNETTDNQKKKKKFYETVRKQEDDVMNELAKRYRDRAKERRANSDFGKGSDILPNTAYHAVGPDNLDMDAAERRKQMIEESKYLGGDIEHTHLVKGLDYALLHKIKTEIRTKDDEETFRKNREVEEAKKEEEQKKKSLAGLTKLADISFDDSNRYAIKSKTAENILKVVFNKQKTEKRNDLFIQGRMAYQYDLVDEFPESDIPTTIILSKAECPNLDAYNTISTNKIVIDKLVQIWSNLRQGTGSKKQKKPKQENKPSEQTKLDDTIVAKGDSIYDNVGDYVPIVKSKRDHHHSKNDNNKQNRNSYFDKKQSDIEESYHHRNQQQNVLEFAASVVGKLASTSDTSQISSINSKAKKSKFQQQEPESYAECYPGAPENDDAIVDSDDDADYSKMDAGTKKGQVNRWDFDTIEEYGDFMSNKEAMPKAAFQYGVKLTDGRKSKKAPTKKEEYAKLDRDLVKINAIIAKRKHVLQDSGTGGGGTSSRHSDDSYNSNNKRNRH